MITIKNIPVKGDIFLPIFGCDVKVIASVRKVLSLH